MNLSAPILDEEIESVQRRPVSLRRAPLEVRVDPLPLDLLNPALAAEAWSKLAAALETAARSLAGRTIWMVNSTPVGGGVAELLRAMLPYWRAAGLEVRWVVLRATPRFFTLTKRLHNWLHGYPGDGGGLGDNERRIYERVIAFNAERLAAEVRPRDLVVLHDPQTAGLAPALAMVGAKIIWRSHVGADRYNELTWAAWEFLSGYVAWAAALVFTRPGFIPSQLAGMPFSVIAPCIDPCATKNRKLPPSTGAAILAQTGIASGESDSAPMLVGRDGRRIVVRRRCDIRRDGSAPRLGHDRLIVHLARWDRLKDPVGVIDCFAGGVIGQADAHLMLAGPGLRAVTDDPEAEGVYRDVEAHWSRLRPRVRRRIHLLRLPMHDLDENAAIVNALQDHANVVIKKSLEEGFGLGVTEAMWKERAVVASAVGGHREQIEHTVNGVLIPDSRDLDAAGAAIVGLIADPRLARRLGTAARRRVRHRFLPDRHLQQWLMLLSEIARTSSCRDSRTARPRGIRRRFSGMPLLGIADGPDAA
jgi:trehalose synthase